MKTGMPQKILSVMLSLLFLGSGFIHLMIHSGGPCSGEAKGNSFSVSECCRNNAVPEIYKVHSTDCVQPIENFCPICAGMFNFVFPGESFRVIQHFPETVFQPVPDSPVSFNDCQLPLSRAPPLS